MQATLAEEQGYTRETVIVGRALQKDFEQRGVHLDPHGQSRALQMTQQIAVMGMHVGQSIPGLWSHLGTSDRCHALFVG